MSIVRATDTVTVWMAHGQPNRLIWRGSRYRVTDEPIRSSDRLFDGPHPSAIDEWHFKGTDEDGHSKLFDVRRHSGGWEVVRVYEP